MAVAQAEKILEPDVPTSENRRRVVIAAGEKAKAKNARLRLMKERNENYLAEQKYEREAEEELTKELRMSTSE